MRTLSFTTTLWAAFVSAAAALQAAESAPQPNILWITCEDIGPQLGCYGDRFADTPNLDALAARGTIYLHAWSNAPVCAPARTTIITGVYPPSTGSQHMRSETSMPDWMKMYPQFLREAGYYCTNNSKTDYNLRAPKGLWDESSNKAHWKNRQPGQPFFAIFNFTNTHESQIRRRPHQAVHDPSGVRVPAYHPDTPEVRQDWGQYYDNITAMDAMAGQKLKEVEDAGLAGDTIVFFYGDHGSGMPRSKRSACNSGLSVPMIVYIPEKFRRLAAEGYEAGGKSDRLVSFVDLAPTLLSLVGIDPPEWIQGHAFLGPHADPPQPFLYGFRGRMDERYDMVRSVRDQRYVYVRNYMPHLPHGQYVRYQFQTPTTAVWKRLFDEGKLNAQQSLFWQPKAAEELYDLQDDPDEVQNLADSPDHRQILVRMRQAQEAWCLSIRDLGFLPEAQIHSRSGDEAPYTYGHDAQRYSLQRIMDTAAIAASRSPEGISALIASFADEDPAVRYWAAMGTLIRGADAVRKAHRPLSAALEDADPSVRTAAAWALAQYGSQDDLDRALPVLVDLADLDKYGLYVALAAMNALDYLDDKAAAAADQIEKLPGKAGGRAGYGLEPAKEKTLADLKR